MRFELSLALKYLLPRAKQLSVSIISVISVLVVALVVWLVVVFLSVTSGIEKKWLSELIALNAPLRVVPNENYYQSYYYQIDNLAQNSNYSTKSLGEKLASGGDPYDPTFDAELPLAFPEPDRRDDGTLKDLAKEAWEAIHVLERELRGKEFEVTFGTLHLDTIDSKTLHSQLSYISSFDGENSALKKLILPPLNEKKEIDLGTGILVSKNFQTNGAKIGDEAQIAYYTEGTKEQRLRVTIAGFYDPGMMPMGNKVLFASPELLATLRGQLSFADNMLGNGFNVWFKNIDDAPRIKAELIKELENRGVASYFTVESFNDFEITKPVLEQLKSDKTLFSLIAIIILIVACSNIISMLILLVNDKKKEIGILQAMGATKRNIACIFGLCGFLTGLIGSVLGMVLGCLTLQYLSALVRFLSFLQGREAFQTALYGSSGLPNEISYSTLGFVWCATIILSLLAGLIPAFKASRMNTATILRSE